MVLERLLDGGYAVAGGTESQEVRSWSAWVLKLDSQGNLTSAPGAWHPSYQVVGIYSQSFGGYRPG